MTGRDRGMLWKTEHRAKGVELSFPLGYCKQIAMRVRQTRRAAQFRPIFSISVHLSAGVSL